MLYKDCERNAFYLSHISQYEVIRFAFLSLSFSRTDRTLKVSYCIKYIWITSNIVITQIKENEINTTFFRKLGYMYFHTSK